MLESTSSAQIDTDNDHGIATRLLIAFIAGFLAVPLFHQSVLAVFAASGVVSATPYSTDPAAVTGLPQVLSRALLGGVYGIVLMLLLQRLVRARAGAAYWIGALAVGAILPSLVSWFVIAPIKGRPLAAGGDLHQLGVALVTNAVWGIGTAAIYSLATRIWRG
jgi:hypothetical protein